jgi:ribonuclease VapC
MIVDTSALIAILRDEPEALSCAHAIESNAVRRVSAANFVEAAVIIDASRDPVSSRRFDDPIKEAQMIIEPVTESQARIARECLSRFRQRQ